MSTFRAPSPSDSILSDKSVATQEFYPISSSDSSSQITAQADANTPEQMDTLGSGSGVDSQSDGSQKTTVTLSSSNDQLERL